MLASFSIIPLGVQSVREVVAEVLSIVDNSGLPYKLGAMQTTVEGEEGEVMGLIMACHRRALELAPRVVTHIAIDDRPGVEDRLTGKVREVEEVLGKELSHE